MPKEQCAFRVLATLAVVMLIAVALPLQVKAQRALPPGQEAGVEINTGNVAGETSNDNAPLMIIRFNQPNVYYKPHLKTAIMRALEVKPNVQFVLENYVPQTGKSSRDKQHAAIAAHNLNKVHEYMRIVGVAEPQITINRHPAPHLLYDEVHLFVY